MADGHELHSVFSRVNISEPSDFGERRIRRLADGIGVTRRQRRGRGDLAPPSPPVAVGGMGPGRGFSLPCAPVARQ